MKRNKLFLTSVIVLSLICLSSGSKDAARTPEHLSETLRLITITEDESWHRIVESYLGSDDDGHWNPGGKQLADYDSVQSWDAAQLECLLPRMVTVKGGIYLMQGKSFESMARKDDDAPFAALVQDFMIADIEVTEELYHFVMGGTFLEEDARLPADKVRWYNAVVFCNRLSLLCGYTPCYRYDVPEKPHAYLTDKIILCDYNADGFRLPSSAEWEYAARGGSESAGYTYIGGNDANAVAWHNGNSQGKLHDVATKAPNELGLYDMAGNVSEWTNDMRAIYTMPSSYNDAGYVAYCNWRILRGSSYIHSEEACTSGLSFEFPAYYMDFDFGSKVY